MWCCLYLVSKNMELQAVKKIIKNGEVAHSKALRDASYSLTLNQKRIVWLFLMEGGNEAGVTVDDELGVMEFKLQAYSAFYDLKPHDASKDVLQALADFNSKEVVFYLDDESTEFERARDEMTWLAKKSYRPKRGSYVVYFNPYLVPYLREMSGTVNPRFKELKKLTNTKYTRLYLKLLEAEEMKIEISVDWMIERFKLPKTYNRYSNFKQRYLTPCVAAIRELVGMENLDYKEIRTGRKITRICFEW